GREAAGARALERFEAGELRHAHVEERDVGLFAAHDFDGLGAVARLADDRDVFREAEEARDAFALEAMIVCEDDADHGSSSGIRARTAKPSLGRVSIASSPPSSARRSRRPSRPLPCATFAEPTPSSRTTATAASPSRASETRTVRARACFTALVSAS